MSPAASVRQPQALRPLWRVPTPPTSAAMVRAPQTPPWAAKVTATPNHSGDIPGSRPPAPCNAPPVPSSFTIEARPASEATADPIPLLLDLPSPRLKASVFVVSTRYPRPRPLAALRRLPLPSHFAFLSLRLSPFATTVYACDCPPDTPMPAPPPLLDDGHHRATLDALAERLQRHALAAP